MTATLCPIHRTEMIWDADSDMDGEIPGTARWVCPLCHPEYAMNEYADVLNEWADERRARDEQRYFASFGGEG